MTTASRRITCSLALLLLVPCTLRAQAAGPVLAVFAHPDDERVIGPLLSRLAREGREAHLLIATDGSKGVREHAGIAAGPALAAERAKEAQCAATRLGVRQLHMLGLEDGGLASFATLARLRAGVAEAITRIQPAVVITFGPEGGTGHPDHRLVGNVVTQVIQGDTLHRTLELFYAQLPIERLRTAPPSNPGVNGVTQELLTVRIPVEERDVAAGAESFACHRTQYTSAEMAAINRTLAHVWNGMAWLRPWNGGAPRARAAGSLLLAARDTIRSILRTVSLDGRVETVHTEDRHFEAPNWSPDGSYFLVNSRGRLYRIAAAGERRLVAVPTGFATRLNNDHGISPDGKQIVISHHAQEHIEDPRQDWLASSVYVLPIDGSESPRKVTTKAPSFWHGWSPDGKTLAYVGRRDGEFDIYTIPVAGGEERRITSCKGLDDGPDYSPDGRYIYYNSYCDGSMQIWRMRPDGSGAEQLTRDAFSNWFPHPSPDGRWLVYLAYLESQGESHPFGRQVKLRLMDLRDRSVRDLTPAFFGGQGTLNVPSWSPDSRRVAYVEYEIVRPASDSSTIARLEQLVEDALVRRDAAFLDSVYAPTFRFKHATGTMETREQRMASVRRPMPANAPGRMTSRSVDSLDVEVHGDVALTTGRIHVLRDGGEPRWQNYTVRYARIWTRKATGQWQLVTHHSTSDAQGAPPPLRP